LGVVANEFHQESATGLQVGVYARQHLVEFFIVSDETDRARGDERHGIPVREFQRSKFLQEDADV
jgi:hypothetical protein